MHAAALAAHPRASLSGPCRAARRQRPVRPERPSAAAAGGVGVGVAIAIATRLGNRRPLPRATSRPPAACAV
eukprot:4508826-Prymnesium_polylepis.1